MRLPSDGDRVTVPRTMPAAPKVVVSDVAGKFRQDAGRQ
jgi:hypothetical protein